MDLDNLCRLSYKFLDSPAPAGSLGVLGVQYKSLALKKHAFCCSVGILVLYGADKDDRNNTFTWRTTNDGQAVKQSELSFFLSNKQFKENIILYSWVMVQHLSVLGCFCSCM